MTRAQEILEAEKRGGMQELQRLSTHMDRQLDFFQSTVSIASLRNYIEEAMKHLETPTP